MSATLLIAIFILGVLLNAFFAGYETGFISTNKIRVRFLAEQEGELNAKRLLAFIEAPDRMITVVLVGTNFALIMGTIAITRQFNGNDVWATIVAMPIFLIFGEIVPKSMFRLHPTRSSLLFLPVIRFFDALLAPIVVPVAWLSKRLVTLTGPGQDMRVFMRSQEDVRVLVDESADCGAIEPEEREMIHSVMDLREMQAKEVMVPRIDIKALPATATRGDLIALLTDSGHTRIPIYEETIDKIIGVVNGFDLLTDTNPEDQEITRLLRGIMHIPDTMRLDDVLKAMRGGRHHVAIVIDEYGGTDGMITIEDILEEIFGEIHDEYDKTQQHVRQVGPGAYVVDARADLDDAASRMGLELSDEKVETIGGWVTHAVGRIPQKGEVIDLGACLVTVLDGTPNRVLSIRLELRREVETDDDGRTV